MASQKIYDIVFAKSKYVNQDGEEKTQWQNVGAIFQNEKGSTYMLLDRAFNPAALPGGEKGNSCILSLFKAENKVKSKSKDEDFPF